jgi:hypothetical protein
MFLQARLFGLILIFIQMMVASTQSFPNANTAPQATAAKMIQPSKVKHPAEATPTSLEPDGIPATSSLSNM